MTRLRHNIKTTLFITSQFGSRPEEARPKHIWVTPNCPIIGLSLSRRLDRCDRVIQNESRDPFGGNVYYGTMQITFLKRQFRNGERNLHCDIVHITTKWVSSLTLDCNGVFAIKAYRPLSRRLDRCDRVIQNESRDPFGGNVCYVTMQITFLTRKFRNGERNLHCDVVHITTKWVSSLTLDCNGVFAIKAYSFAFRWSKWAKIARGNRYVISVVTLENGGQVTSR